jgi:alanyl-tRNA synthetase
VVDVQKYATSSGHVIVHKVRGATFRKGEKVHGHVDWDRRTGHTRHHTATHLILASAKQVLGFHTWQGGAQKGHERSRVDIQHYNRITDEQLRAIEELANKAVLENHAVEKAWMPRDQAEKAFGMQLYQGGIPKGNNVRVVTVREPAAQAGGITSAGAEVFDVECCGGTHVGSTNEIGAIKILRTERIQDGLERIEFSAGLAAIRQMQKKDELLRAAAETLSVQPEELPKTALRFFEEWKQLRAENESLKAQLSQLMAKVPPTELPESVASTHVGAKVAVFAGKGMDVATLRGIAQSFPSKGVPILALNLEGQFVAAGPGALELAKKAGEGRAGGKPDLAQGANPKLAANGTKDAVRKALDLIGE